MEKFRPGKITIAQEKGIQSIVDVGEIGGIPAIRKVSGEGLLPWQLEELRSAINIYRDQLIDVGLSIPRNFYSRINGGLEVVDEYINGVDIDTAIRMGRGEVGIRKIVRTLCGLQGKELFLDAKPANWIDTGEDLYFIDLFPPPLKGEDGHIVPWYQSLYKRQRELFTFNYGDIRGQTTKMLAQARFSYPNQLRQMERVVLEGLRFQDCFEYVEDQIKNDYPDMNHFYAGNGDIRPRLRELA
jgi:hypothetical protein